MAMQNFNFTEGALGEKPGNGTRKTPLTPSSLALAVRRPCRLCGQFLVHATPNQLLAQLLAATLNQCWTVA